MSELSAAEAAVVSGTSRTLSIIAAALMLGQLVLSFVFSMGGNYIWDLINTLQMYYYIPLIDFKISEVVLSFLQFLSFSNISVSSLFALFGISLPSVGSTISDSRTGENMDPSFK